MHICVLAGSLLAAAVSPAGEMALLTPSVSVPPAWPPFLSAEEGVLGQGRCLQLLPVIVSLCL